MKRSKLKRRLGRFKQPARKPLRRVSKKRAAINRKAKPARAKFVEAAGCCDMCGHTENLCGHEFVQSDRVHAFTNEAVILILCNDDPRTGRGGCHQAVHREPSIWTFIRCLALLQIRRPEKYNLAEACRLEGKHVEQDDVDFAVEKLLETDGRRRA